LTISHELSHELDIKVEPSVLVPEGQIVGVDGSAAKLSIARANRKPNVRRFAGRKSHRPDELSTPFDPIIIQR
jgi:hypothetical protein